MPTPQGFAVEVSDQGAGPVRIRVRGELDMSAAPELTDTIGKVDEGATVVLDMTGVTFLDSSAIGALVGCGRELSETGGRLQIGPRSDIVTRVLEITGLTEPSGAFDVLPLDG